MENNERALIEGGYILIARKIRESQSYSRGLEYVGLMTEFVIRANHNDRFCYGMTCQRGQFICSVVKMAESFGLSRSKMNRMLKHLASDKFLILKADSKKTIVTICNYDTYQDFALYKRTTSGQQTDIKRTSSGQPPDTNNELKELNTLKEINKEKRFVEFWEKYPERNGKKIGKAESKKLFGKFNEDKQKRIVLACKNYAASGQMAKDAERFLKKDYWKEWEAEAKEKRPAWGK